VEDRNIVIAAPSEPAAAAVDGRARPRAASVERERILVLRGLRKSYGARVVLDGLDADLERGALTVVTGPSGSGKTTLLDLVVGLERPDAGSIRLFDQEISGLDRAGSAALRRESIGYVPQQPTLVPFLSARENVELALRLRGREEGALDALAAVGLADRAEQRVERLSGGETLRVAIARALASRPALLVAVEPTSRLDEANAAAVAALFASLAREWGAAVVLASHDPVVVEQADARVELG
jgi:putative ABC transport system ATP-binding protein